jgi:PHD/YefM family antitoxin component YafN of YafNO toxin-antitoxin module
MAANKRAKQKDKRAKPRAREAMSQTGLPKPKSPPKSPPKSKSKPKPQPKPNPKTKPKPKPKPDEARVRAAKLEIPEGARALPLAALRSALGTEVDRVRQLGGYTLILRRGRPVAAVIPYEEFRRYRMEGDKRPLDEFERDERARRGAEILAGIQKVREAIARSDAAKKARGEPIPVESAADLINRLRAERTQQVLDAAEGRS